MDAAGWGTIAGTFIFVLIWVIAGIWDNRRAGLARREPELTAEELLRDARAIKRTEHHKAIQAWQSEYDRLMQPEWARINRQYADTDLHCTHTEWINASTFTSEVWICRGCGRERAKRFPSTHSLT